MPPEPYDYDVEHDQLVDEAEGAHEASMFDEEP
jgi:hypothetical protein